MKSNLLSAILVGVLLLTTTVNAFLTVWYFVSVRQLEKLQVRHFKDRQILTMFDALLRESSQYAKKNEAIIPILKDLEVRILSLRTNSAAQPVAPVGVAPPPGPVTNATPNPNPTPNP